MCAGRVDGGRWTGATKIAVVYAIWHEFEGRFLRVVPAGETYTVWDESEGRFLRKVGTGELEKVGCVRRRKEDGRQKPPEPTIPAIDDDMRKIFTERCEAESELRDNLGRQPLDIEIAGAVAHAYPERNKLVQTAIKKFDDLVKELQTREYVFPGFEDVTKREALPVPRR